MHCALQIKQHLSPDLPHKLVFNLARQSAGWRTPSVFIFRLVFSARLRFHLRDLSAPSLGRSEGVFVPSDTRLLSPLCAADNVGYLT